MGLMAQLTLETISPMSKMGADLTENPDGLVLKQSELKGTRVDGWRDHRIVMALAIAGLLADGETIITGKEYTDITYPDFTTHMTLLEADIS